MRQLQVSLFQSGIIKTGSRNGVICCFLRQDMSLAILLSSVLIHLELMPRGELIKKEQKKRPSKRPILDLLHVWSVHDKAEELSVIFNNTG